MFNLEKLWDDWLCQGWIWVQPNLEAKENLQKLVTSVDVMALRPQVCHFWRGIAICKVANLKRSDFAFGARLS